MSDNKGLYYHIPFCRQKCPYCDFYSAKTEIDTVVRYAGALISETEKYSDSTMLFDTIYFGGGTPNLLGAENISKVIENAKQCFSISSPEITVECNPSSDLEEFFSILAKVGVNRISVGLQSALQSELDFLGRKHTAHSLKQTVMAAKSAGINNISVDLMFGLPNQTFENLDKSIDFVLSLDVPHISAYMLKVEKSTPFFEVGIITDDDCQAELYMHLCERLTGLYKHYEISNFCREGFESRHNLKYWTGAEYLGIGASAHSFLNQKRFFYPRSTADFINSPKAVPDGLGGDADERHMLLLRLSDGIKSPVPDNIFRRALKLSKTGLVIADKQGVRLTEKGFLLSNTLIGNLING